MYLMRIGAAGSEKPVVRIDDTHYVDVSDVVPDFNEAFFGGDGIRGPSAVVRRAGDGRTADRIRRGTHRRPHRPAPPDPVHRPELQRPCGRDRGGGAGRADPVHQVAEHAHRPLRRRPHPARLDETRLGGRAGHRDRPPNQLPRLRRRSARARSPGSPWSTTSASGPSRSSAAGNGPRASPPRPSTRPARGW